MTDTAALDRPRVGFIGLGNVGGKLAGSVLRNGFPLTVVDPDPQAVAPLAAGGAAVVDTPKALAEAVDVVITCLPSPAICAAVLEGADGVIAGLGPGKIWLEMSTTDAAEVQRIGALVQATGAMALDSPVSGGCHRAATGNIAVFVGGPRAAFDRAFPVLQVLGRRILHTGDLGSASTIKVVTNYLASAHLVALGEALVTAHQAGLDMRMAYEAIRISSGNSFVHETESQVILNGSYNINFTMDLVDKDVGLFLDLARAGGVPTEVGDLVHKTFLDGAARYGGRAWSSMIVKRLEDACGVEVRAPGFPDELVDDEPEALGWEVRLDQPPGAGER